MKVMKETNQLENQLRSWIPRRPSADLKARIFQHAPSAAPGSTALAEEVFPWLSGFRWVAPGFAALLLSLVLLGRNPQGLTQLMSTPPISMVATVALSQPHL